MRTVLISLIALLYLGLAAPVQAERRMFVVANDPDGYGVDRCLASGEKCGAAAANAYCKTHAFAEAATYHKADRRDITGTIPDSTAASCSNNACNVVAIICTR
ncbi:MAG TPA: hypothetical protein VIV34_05055 [Pseudolabrys sp.]